MILDYTIPLWGWLLLGNLAIGTALLEATLFALDDLPLPNKRELDWLAMTMIVAAWWFVAACAVCSLYKRWKKRHPS